MAGNAVIGALRVVLGADTAALDKGLGDAEKRLSAFGATMAKAGAAGAAAFGAASLALGLSIKHAIDEADKLGKMSQKIGIPVEELSGLKLAADLSGVSIESLGKGVGKLSKAMVEAAANPASEAAKAFKSIGVSAVDSDGKLKSSSVVLADIAGKYENLKDGAGKTANAMALFGRAGADLIPLLNSGKAGLQGMIREAAELGIVIDNQTAKSAEAFNDNLTRLGKVYDGLVLRITAQMLPALQQFSQTMIDASKNSELVKQVAEGIVTALKGVASFVVQTVVVFQRLGAELSALVGALKLFKTQAEADAAWAKYRAEGEKTKLVFADMATFVERFWQASKKGAEDAAPPVKKNLGEINLGALAAKTALDKFLDTQKKSIAATNADAQAVGKAAGEREKLRVIMQGEEVARQNDIALTWQKRLALIAAGESAEQAQLKMAGAQLIQQALPAWQQYELGVRNAEAALKAIGATAEQKSLVLTKMAQDAGATWTTQAANMAGSFKDLATAFGKENRTMAIAAKAFAITQAIINTWTGYTKALASLPPPFNFAAAAAVVASGLAAVATIAAQPIPAMRSGGMLQVPGGVGGGDTRLFQAMLEPGELVNVTPNSAQRGGMAGGSGARALEISVPARIAYPRAVIEDLIAGFNDALGDGHKLRFT